MGHDRFMEIRRTQEFDRRLKKLADAKAKARIAIAYPENGGRQFRRLQICWRRCERSAHPLRSGFYRVYYIRRGLEIVVLLVCGDKASQAADIVHAREMASDL